MNVFERHLAMVQDGPLHARVGLTPGWCLAYTWLAGLVTLDLSEGTSGKWSAMVQAPKGWNSGPTQEWSCFMISPIQSLCFCFLRDSQDSAISLRNVNML